MAGTSPAMTMTSCTTSQPEHVEHQRVALLLEFRRVDETRPRDRARPRDDRDILLAVDLERHRRRGKARAHVDLPQLVERGVVILPDRPLQYPQQHTPPTAP